MMPNAYSSLCTSIVCIVSGLFTRSGCICIPVKRKITQLSLVWRLTIERKNRDGDDERPSLSTQSHSNDAHDARRSRTPYNTAKKGPYHEHEDRHSHSIATRLATARNADSAGSSYVDRVDGSACCAGRERKVSGARATNQASDEICHLDCAVHRATPDMASSADPVAQRPSDLARMAQDAVRPFFRWTVHTGNARPGGVNPPNSCRGAAPAAGESKFLQERRQARRSWFVRPSCAHRAPIVRQVRRWPNGDQQVTSQMCCGRAQPYRPCRPPRARATREDKRESD